MPFTNFPYGVTSFGIPLLGDGSRVSIPRSGGQVLFVDGTNGTDGNEGKTPLAALATIQAAVDKLSGAGDTIFVFPGQYAENVVLTGLDDVSLISACYVGRGVTTHFRPSIEPAAGRALVLAQCNRIRVEGFYIQSLNGAGVLTDSEGCCFVNCEIEGATAEAVKFLSATDAAFTGSGTSFLGCIFDGSVNGIKVYKSTAPDTTGQATNVVVSGCQFYGNSGPDVAAEATGAADDMFDSWLFENCAFQDKAKAVYLNMTDGNGISPKCVFANCYFASVAALSAVICVIPTGTSMIACYDTNGVVDTSAF